MGSDALAEAAPQRKGEETRTCDACGKTIHARQTRWSESRSRCEEPGTCLQRWREADPARWPRQNT
jgi:hypothetical protein